MTIEEFRKFDIKKLRNNLGYNQPDMATAIGISLNSYKLWESHCCKNPKKENLQKLDELAERV